jgi:uncharacterized membrane protein
VVSQSRAAPGALVLCAGPVAWFIELNLGYALAAGPCFSNDHRLTSPAAQWAWTHTGLLCLAALCMLVTLWSFGVSLAVLRQHSSAADAATAASRRHFAALWGAAFGGGFFVATLLTFVGLILLPRCGG